MKTFTLNTKTHTDFLAQERKDPVTGEPFHAGEEVVFCAHCRSAFHKDSWEYLGGTHCGQDETLTDFPIQRSLSLQQRPGAQLFPRPLLPEELKAEKKKALSLKRFLGISSGLVLGGIGSAMAFFEAANQTPGSHTPATTLFFLSVLSALVGGGMLGMRGLIPTLFFLRTEVFSQKKKLVFYENAFTTKSFFSKQEIFRTKALTRIEAHHYPTSTEDKLRLFLHQKNGGVKKISALFPLQGEVEMCFEGLILLSRHLPVQINVATLRDYNFLEQTKTYHEAPAEIILREEA